MHIRLTLCSALAFALIFAIGCAPIDVHNQQASVPAPANPAAPAAPRSEAHAVAMKPVQQSDAAPPTVPAPLAKSQPPARADMVALLQAANGLDPATKAQLAADLEHTDPSLWPLLVEQLKATVAYRNKLGVAASSSNPAAETLPATEQIAPVVAHAAQAPRRPVRSVRRPPKESLQIARSTVNAQLTSSEPPLPDTAQPKTNSTATAAPNRDSNVTPVTNVAAENTVPRRIAPAAKRGRPLPTAGSSEAWQDHLAAAVTGLEQESGQAPSNADEISKHALLRLLYLAQGKRDDALRPIDGIPPAQQDFWSKQLYALSAYIDAKRNPDPSRRAAEAKLHLTDATARLGELATLHVRNLVFCTEVTSYGVYKKLDKYEFQPGQEVLLYAEVENFKSQASDKGFHTALKGSYQILDPKGARVAEQEFPVAEEYCQNPRRDYFTRYFVWLPKRIYNGTYTLQLTIEDTLSQKLGQATLEFSIKEK